jgi:hypothetical protein
MAPASRSVKKRRNGIAKRCNVSKSSFLPFFAKDKFYFVILAAGHKARE